MSDVRLCSPGEVDAAALHGFLERFFGTRKAAFLDRHGSWWYGDRKNQLVLVAGGTIAAYCGVIPARCRIEGRTWEGLWWIDLVVAPEFRGRGLQTIFDREVRRRSRLLLGFPNELAARIHRKHGWGVREDLRAVLAPLDPPRLGTVLRARGARRGLLRTAARSLTPFAALWRRRLSRYRARQARRVEEPNLGKWAEIATRGEQGAATALRDEDHLRRRYLDAPYRDELVFYETPSLALATRRVHVEGRTEERVLDLFGDLGDRESLDDVLRFCLGEAVRSGAVQVTALAGHAVLADVFRRSGFLASSTARFCWSSPDAEVMGALARSRPHWCLGDSDNDDPF